MGAIAEGIANYARPLIDATDGSMDQMNRALTISQLCWNLSLLPEDARENFLAEFRPILKMDDDEFDDFRRSVVIPMVRRHEEMIPRMHQRGSLESLREPAVYRIQPPPSLDKNAHIGRNARCPCNSGLKYKICCGRP